MFWFNGSVSEAINKSRNEDKVFLVFIKGNDDMSKKMNEMYTKLDAILSSMNLVAINLDSNSENCKLFSQIYPVIVVPSTYFIDKNGIAIEIIAGCVDNENELKLKIEKVIEGCSVADVVQTQSTDADNSREVIESCSDANPSDVMDVSEPNHSSNVTDINEVESIEMETENQTKDNNSESSASNELDTSGETSELALEQKIERANQLLESLRVKKLKEEEEQKRTDEIKRRNEMKEMQKGKRLREQTEVSDAIRERESEKMVAKLERERVLAQIAADREERRARQLLTEGHVNQEPQQTERTAVNSPYMNRLKSERTRIQFRFPDGSTKTQDFFNSESLDTLRQYLLSNTSFRNFTLSTTFPRRVFEPNDYSQTLADLSLCPSSVLLVIPNDSRSRSQAVTSPSFLMQIISTLFSPFAMIWSVISRYWGTPNRSAANAAPNPVSATSSQESRNVKPDSRPQFYDRDGNVARIRNRKDDDENNTWNGNSTQQM